MTRFIHVFSSVLIASLLSPISIFAQDIQEISVGTGYNKHSFVDLSTGEQKQADNSSWDISFSVVGTLDAGIFINESAGSIQGQPVAGVYAYDTGIFEFSETPDTAVFLKYPLINNEGSWEYGALNEGRNPDNPSDYGWGYYNAQNQTVEGEKVFVIELRNGQFKKLMITELSGSTYTFRHANLDGTEEVTFSINKNDHAGHTMAYYSFAANATVDIETEDPFDLLYSRYLTKIVDPSSGNYIDYQVTGILTGHHTKVAIADGVDPATVDFTNYRDSLSTRLDVIGHDWKTFSGTGWSLDQDRVYFLQTADGHVWKLRFTDFDGSSTGNAEFEKTDLGILSSVSTSEAAGMQALVYPNPSTSKIYIALDQAKASNWNGRLEIINSSGLVLHQQLV